MHFLGLLFEVLGIEELGGDVEKVRRADSVRIHGRSVAVARSSRPFPSGRWSRLT